MYFLRVYRNFIVCIMSCFNSTVSVNDIVHYETRCLSVVLDREDTQSNCCMSLVRQHTEKLLSTKYFNIHFKGCS
jgi:hypothetical protein